MEKKRIKDMTEKELLQYISGQKDNIKASMKSYNDYYNGQMDRIQKKIKSHKSIDVIRQYAYEMKNLVEEVEWSYQKRCIDASLEKTIKVKPKRGEIWTCQLGKNIGSEENKIRPVIIVQNNTGNENAPTTIIVPISHRPKKIATHILLRKGDYTIVDGELDKITGTILCEQIKVISKARLGRHIGTLHNNFVTNILNNKLKTSLNLQK